jgi:hypothetical protein
LALRADRPRKTTYEHGGRKYALSSGTSQLVYALFGKVRSCGRLAAVSAGAVHAILPVDRDLGLCSS